MIELRYNVEVDENKVADGRELAEGLIRDAYRFLLPYSNECLACTNEMFSVIANQAIEKSHNAKRTSGSRYFCESLFWASQPKQAAKT